VGETIVLSSGASGLSHWVRVCVVVCVVTIDEQEAVGLLVALLLKWHDSIGHEVHRRNDKWRNQFCFTMFKVMESAIYMVETVVREYSTSEKRGLEFLSNCCTRLLGFLYILNYHKGLA